MIFNEYTHYCFYNIIEQTKKNKLKLCLVINLVEFSRANRFNNDPDYSDDDENWVFGYMFDSIAATAANERLQLQATNCSTCGNYVKTLNYRLATSLLCKCNNLSDDNVSENSDEWMNIY